MAPDEFLDLVLKNYESTFDIYRPYEFNGTTYPAYCYFWSHNEKYVLTQKANLWSADSFEHMFFIYEKTIDKEYLANLKETVKQNIEPSFVRKGSKNPEKNHMYSFITIVLMCDELPDKAALKALKGTRFMKNYLYSIRGYSELRLLCIGLNDKNVASNVSGSQVAKLYKKYLLNQ